MRAGPVHGARRDEACVRELRLRLRDLALVPRDVLRKPLALGGNVDLDIEHDAQRLDDLHGRFAPRQPLDEAHLRNKTTDAAIASYQDARLDGLRAALGILAVMAIVALLLANRIPTVQPGKEVPGDRAGPDDEDAGDTFV